MRTPAEHRLACSIGGQTTALRVDMAALGKRSAAGHLARFEAEADPDGTMSPEARHAKALALRRLHMSKLALKGVQAKRAKAGAR